MDKADYGNSQKSLAPTHRLPYEVQNTDLVVWKAWWALVGPDSKTSGHAQGPSSPPIALRNTQWMCTIAQYDGLI